MPVEAAALVKPQRALLFGAGQQHDLVAAVFRRDRAGALHQRSGAVLSAVRPVRHDVFDQGVGPHAVRQVFHNHERYGGNHGAVRLSHQQVVAGVAGKAGELFAPQAEVLRRAGRRLGEVVQVQL